MAGKMTSAPKPIVNVELGADGSIQSAERAPEFDDVIDGIIKKHGGKVNEGGQLVPLARLHHRNLVSGGGIQCGLMDIYAGMNTGEMIPDEDDDDGADSTKA